MPMQNNILYDYFALRLKHAKARDYETIIYIRI